MCRPRQLRLPLRRVRLRLWPRLACALAARAGGHSAEAAGASGAAYGRTHLCVFIPTTARTRKDAALVGEALRTWASPEVQQAAGAWVRFVHPGNGSDWGRYAAPGIADAVARRRPRPAFPRAPASGPRLYF
ncbi:unnamed protein product [Prorocentrum cordatum]|uniref:Uncharacterized protein n=1 Tax=Prorocentrum cordatum TaxID=2364126 RepID=A0ABN9X7B8_9DINO|nr:unnamed protein product [Polarella glacialis]